MSSGTEVYKNTFQTPNLLVDRLMDLLTDQELRIALFATRHILGWGGNADQEPLSITAFEQGHRGSNGCGLSRPSIVNALKSLWQLGIMQKAGRTKDGQLWRITRDESTINWDKLAARQQAQQTKRRRQTDKATRTSQANRQQRKNQNDTPDSIEDQASGGTSDVPAEQASISTSHVPLPAESDGSISTSDVPADGTCHVLLGGTSDVRNETHTRNPSRNPTDSADAPGGDPPAPVWDGQSTIIVNLTAIDGKRPDYDVYIGRANKRAGLKRSKWANPFKIGKDGSRDEVIAKYRVYLDEHPDLLRAIPELVGKRLGCWCAPESCHGDVLTALANAYARGEWQPPEKPVQPHIALIDAYWSALPGGKPIGEDYPRHVKLAIQVHEAGYTPAQVTAFTRALYDPESPFFDRFWSNKIMPFEEVIRRLPIWAETEKSAADDNQPVDLNAPEWQGVQMVVFRPETLQEKLQRAQKLIEAEHQRRATMPSPEQP